MVHAILVLGWAAIGVIAALVAEAIIAVEKCEEQQQPIHFLPRELGEANTGYAQGIFYSVRGVLDNRE